MADKLTDKLKAIPVSGFYDRHKIELLIEQCLKWIRGQYTGSEDDVDIIIGLFGRPLHKERGKTPYLAASELHFYRGDSLTACLAPVRGYCIAGMDVTLASFILKNAHNPFGMVAEAKRLGILILTLQVIS